MVDSGEPGVEDSAQQVSLVISRRAHAALRASCERLGLTRRDTIEAALESFALRTAAELVETPAQRKRRLIDAAGAA